MPTANPRVNVTLSQSLDALVTRLAELQRVSKSSVLRELLETAEPQLLQMVALMEAATKARTESKKTLSEDMRAAVDSLLRDAHVVMARAGNLTRDLVAEAETVRGRRPARAVSAAASPRAAAGRESGGKVARKSARRRKDPPASNRGVKS